MQYVYVAMNNSGLIKIGTTNDKADRQNRFNQAKHNKGMRIMVAVALAKEGRAYAWAVESLLRYDLSLYNVRHGTMDTFHYNGTDFHPKAYINAFARKVAKAEAILDRTKTRGYLL